MTTEKLVKVTIKMKGNEVIEMTEAGYDNWLKKAYLRAMKTGMTRKYVDDYLAKNYLVERFEREDNRKTFVGVFWVHAGGDDRSYDVEIKAVDLKEAEAEMVKILKRKKSAVLNDYCLEEKKTPKLSKKPCARCGKMLPEIDNRGMKFKPYHYKGKDCCSYECVAEVENEAVTAPLFEKVA